MTMTFPHLTKSFHLQATAVSATETTTPNPALEDPPTEALSKATDPPTEALSKATDSPTEAPSTAGSSTEAATPTSAPAVTESATDLDIPTTKTVIVEDEVVETSTIAAEDDVIYTTTIPTATTALEVQELNAEDPIMSGWYLAFLTTSRNSKTLTQQ